jgi:hypothetical protein
MNAYRLSDLSVAVIVVFATFFAGACLIGV